MVSLLTIGVVITVIYFLYSYYSYRIKINRYKKLLNDPEYFFVNPMYYFHFSSLYDIKNYNAKNFNQALKNTDKFCKLLFMLNLTDNSNTHSTPDKENLFKINCLLRELDVFRLETINTLETLIITIYPNDFIVNKLKGMIDIINLEMIKDTGYMYKKFNLNYKEHYNKPVSYKKPEKGDFFTN